MFELFSDKYTNRLPELICNNYSNIMPEPSAIKHIVVTVA